MVRRNGRTKGEAETAIRHAIIKFEQEFMGRGPMDVKAMRQNLISQGREKLCAQLTEITGATVVGLFTDIDVHIGERVIVFSLDQDLELIFR